MRHLLHVHVACCGNLLRALVQRLHVQPQLLHGLHPHV